MLYETPQITTIGAVNEYTQSNKIGSVSDIYTQLIPDIVGPVVPQKKP